MLGLYIHLKQECWYLLLTQWGGVEGYYKLWLGTKVKVFNPARGIKESNDHRFKASSDKYD